MINVKKEGILLHKTELGFEHEGVLNPAVIQAEGKIHLFYRALAKDNYSTIGYCELSSPLVVANRHDTPLLFPLAEYESRGLEDPRIVKLDEVFYLTYTAYDGVNALGALATSTDLIHWERHGIVVPQITYEDFKHLAESKGTLNEKYIRYNEYQKSHDKQDHTILLWDKNLLLFPRKINGTFRIIHRIKPDIQIVVSTESLDNLTPEFWREYLLNFDESIVLRPKYDHEVSYIGGGCPPIETEEGWLLIYHGVHDSLKGYVYSACAALLDLEHPQKEIARLPYPLFKPELEWELKGEVNNVCFPTGALVIDDTIYIYYGAADERIAVASVSKSELISELLKYKI
ncbi:MAG: pesticidal protein Cry7Aa [Flavobacteriales bacterium]